MRALLTLLTLLVSMAVLADGQPKVGEPAPDFRLQDQNGDWHELADYQDKWLAVYFYPKDDTPGCTTEACNFRDNIYAFKRIGAEVVGISLDDVESHKKFAEEYKLPFTLLADVSGETVKAYGVMGSFMLMDMAKRQSFLIDPEGNIAKHYAKVNPDQHTQEVLADLEALMAEAAP
jgi:peroxiredoxin Q/BCP